MQSDFWTDEKVEALKLGAGHGLSASALGALLRCSRNAVIGKARRIGVRLTGVSRNGGPGGGATVEIVPERVASEIEAAIEGKITAPLEPAAPRPKPQPVVETLFDLLAPVEPGIGVPIGDLGLFHCRAVLNGASDAETVRYCGEPTAHGSWCAAHHALYCVPRPQATRARLGRWS